MDDATLLKIRKRIYKCVLRIQEVAFDLRDIAENELIPPSYEEFKTEKCDLYNYHFHLTGLLHLIRSSLLEVGDTWEIHGRSLTPKTWRRMSHLSEDIIKHAGYAIIEREDEKNAREPRDYLYWDEREWITRPPSKS